MNAKDTKATHRQLVKLAHLVLQEHPREPDLGELTEYLKRRCSRAGLTFSNTGEIARALDSALWQRRHL